ncbi:ethionine resistance protein [Dispira parvispora]|uniref:Ethionine resistance protein n=1 Tax=Dispira parvispora TaxID=1520584 RepID=A0A9W8ATL3_9FUNG|nr:ethionine resistance protein [Dispira parvispora]
MSAGSSARETSPEQSGASPNETMPSTPTLSPTSSPSSGVKPTRPEFLVDHALPNNPLTSIDIPPGSDMGAFETQPLLSEEYVAADQTSNWTWRKLGVEVLGLVYKSVPVMTASGFQNVNSLLAVMVLGHIGTKALAAFTLASMISSLTALSPLLGFLTALDTLCSQAATGAEYPGMPGIYLQRCLLFAGCFMIPVATLWWNIETVLLYIGQDPEIAAMAAYYQRFQILLIISGVTFEAVKKFLIAQGRLKEISAIQIVGTTLGWSFFYLTVINPTTTLGFVGVPVALALSYNLNTILTWLWFTQVVRQRPGWTGFTWSAFRGWPQIAYLAFPGALSVSAEVVAFDLLTLAMSYLGPVALAAQSIIMTILQGGYLLFTGVGVVVGNEVGNHLGAAATYRARQSALVGLVAVFCGAVVLSLVLFGGRHQWGLWFNPDPKVNVVVAMVIPLVCIVYLLQSINLVAAGILRGQGRQRIGAVVNLVSYYAVAVPAGFVMIYFLRWGFVSLWFAVVLAVLCSTLGALAVVLQSDWHNEVNRCQARLADDSRMATMVATGA